MPKAILEAPYSPLLVRDLTESDSYSKGDSYSVAEGRITVAPILVGVI